MYHSCEGHNRLPYAGVNSGQLQTNRAQLVLSFWLISANCAAVRYTTKQNPK